MKHATTLLWMMTAIFAVHMPASLEAKGKKKPPVTSATSTPQQNPVQQAAAQLSAYTALQQALPVQTADLAYAMRKALIAADLLIQADGTLDLGSVALVKATFVPANPLEWEANMGKVLDQLDTSWQGFFTGIKAPNVANQAAQAALKAMFSLSSNQTVTDRHAKVAVLASMLSPYNQGPVGDCFAVNDVIRDHQEYYKHAAIDYQSIVMNGYVARPANGSIDYFFFLPILADDDLSQTFELTAAGGFANTGRSLMDAPGFIAASLAMGGINGANLTQNIMGVLNSQLKGDLTQVTASIVISAMAQVLSSNLPNSSIDALTAAGQYAFSALTNNTVLRGVEAAFAAMAEDLPNDSTRGNINQSLSQALQDTWHRLQGTAGSSQFQQTFMNTFNASFRLLYNESIPLLQPSSDGSSTTGAFQLYERIGASPNLLGHRIATPQDFRQLVLDAINRTALQFPGAQGMQAIASQLTQVVNTDLFLQNVLWDYDSANQQEPDPVGHYQNLSRTPMQSPDGDNPFAVDDLDTQTSYDSHVQSYTPSNTKDLVSWCLTLAKTAPHELIPMDSPQHAFNFVPTNPDIGAFLQQKQNTSKWLQSALITPGMTVSRKTITAATQNALANTMYSMISSALPNGVGYQNLLRKLSSTSMSVRDYANKLLQGINQLLGSDANQAQQIAVALDGVLIESLPINDQMLLNHSAVRFAFTNWNQGTKNIYFCAYFNPRTEAIGFASIFEDKTNLQPMDETEWVNGQTWDVDLTPFAPPNTFAG